MPRLSLANEIKVSKAIDQYLDENPMTTATQVADAVEKETGFRPSVQTIYAHIASKGLKKMWVKDE